MTVINKSIYPINDGGLFYRMVIDLQQNNYRIPEFTTYNQQNIPYAYPPLPFYLIGLINTWLKIDLFALFRFLPFAFNTIAIPIVYLLVRKLLYDNEEVALLSTVFWAMLPPSFEWLIMGGGITRSIAFTFSLAACYFFIEYLTKNNIRFLISGIVTGGITGLSHLEIFWVLCFTTVLIWIFYSRNRNYILPLLYFIIGWAVLLSPYIYSVVSQHGFTPFFAGFSSGEFSWIKPLKEMILFRVTDEFYLTIIAVLAIFGIYSMIINKKYFFVVWFLASMILDPRSINRSVLLPLSIMAALFLVELLKNTYNVNLPLFSKFKLINPPNLIGIFLITQVFMLTYLRSTIYFPTYDSLSSSEMEAINWINDNLPDHSNFVNLTQSPIWQLDHFNEWFPALTEQTSLTTVQGSEWVDNGYHRQVIQYYNGYKSCLYEDLPCMEKTMKFIGERVDYVIVNHDNCDPEKIFCLQSYAELLKFEPQYQTLYDSQDVTIYKVLAY
jgi:hypothetical protein